MSKKKFVKIRPIKIDWKNIFLTENSEVIKPSPKPKWIPKQSKKSK